MCNERHNDQQLPFIQRMIAHVLFKRTRHMQAHTCISREQQQQQQQQQLGQQTRLIRSSSLFLGISLASGSRFPLLPLSSSPLLALSTDPPLSLPACEGRR